MCKFAIRFFFFFLLLYLFCVIFFSFLCVFYLQKKKKKKKKKNENLDEKLRFLPDNHGPDKKPAEDVEDSSEDDLI